MYLHCAHQPSQAGLKAFPKEASIFFSSLTIGPSSLLSTLRHQGLRFLLLTPSAWNILPAHFPHYLILQVSAQRSLPQRSPLGLTSTLPTAPWTSSSYQLPQRVMVPLHIFENDCVIAIPLPPLDHGFHEDMHRVYFCLWLYPGANHRARRIVGSQE